jgi:hypothetical protein
VTRTAAVARAVPPAAVADLRAVPTTGSHGATRRGVIETEDGDEPVVMPPRPVRHISGDRLRQTRLAAWCPVEDRLATHADPFNYLTQDTHPAVGRVVIRPCPRGRRPVTMTVVELEADTALPYRIVSGPRRACGPSCATAPPTPVCSTTGRRWTSRAPPRRRTPEHRAWIKYRTTVAARALP